MTASLHRAALRVLLPGFTGTTLPPAYAALLADGLGGICLFGTNTAAGPAALRELTDAIRTAAPDPVIAVDEEGGDVTRLHADRGSPVLGAAALGRADDLVLTRETARAIGTDLAASGIGLDLAPVADVNTNPDNPVIGTRSFGADAPAVAAHVGAWVRGLQETGVAACVKHFPGHGDTAQDSHVELPRVDADLATLEARELLPFDAAVDAGVAAVMTSHLLVTALDPELPATLSRPVLSWLRARAGDGPAIVTDALDMAGASAGRGIPEAAVGALVAGADLLCLGTGFSAASVRQVADAIVEAVCTGRLHEARVLEAAERVDSLGRQRRATTMACVVDRDRQLAGARRSVTVDGRLPDLRGAAVVSVATPANIAVGEVSWGLPPDRLLTPDDDLPGDGPLVVQVRDAVRRPEVAALLGRLAESGRAAVVVEWGWPGDWPDSWDGLARICTRGSSQPGAAVVVEMLRKAGWDG